MAAKQSYLSTTSAVMDALGGTRTCATLTGRNYPAAWMWRKAPTFPPDTYLVMQAALTLAGLEAPPVLWGMIEGPAREAAQ